ADVLAAERDRHATGSAVGVDRGRVVGALVVVGLAIAEQRAVGDVGGRAAVGFGAARLTGDQVDGTGARRSELGAVGVVIEREVLRQVPQPGDRVAVVVVHHDPVRPIAAGVG